MLIKNKLFYISQEIFYMNKFHLIIVLIMSSTFFLEGCDASENEAVSFYDQVHKPIEQCIDHEEIFHQQIDLFFENNSENVPNSRLKDSKQALAKLRDDLENLKAICAQSKHDLDSLTIIEGGEGFHRSAVNVVAAYLSLCENELPQLVKLMELPPREDDEDWYKQMDHLLYLLDSKVNERMEIFEQEAYEFAEQNAIELFEE
jgi:hypothetical protein